MGLPWMGPLQIFRAAPCTPHPMHTAGVPAGGKRSCSGRGPALSSEALLPCGWAFPIFPTFSSKGGGPCTPLTPLTEPRRAANKAGSLRAQQSTYHANPYMNR